MFIHANRISFITFGTCGLITLDISYTYVLIIDVADEVNERGFRVAV